MPNVKKRNIMRKFRIGEISAVDRPAQEGGVATLMKRNNVTVEDDINKRYVLSSGNEGHSHLISLNEHALFAMGGETSWTNGHDHPFVINDNGTITIGTSADHDHSIEVDPTLVLKGDYNTSNDKKSKRKNSTNKAANQGGSAHEDAVMPNKDAENELATLKADLVKANSILALNSVQKAYYENLSDDAKVDFLSKSDTEREAVITASKAADPIVYTAKDGTEYRKSDDARFVALAKQSDEDREKLEKSEAKNEQLAFEKQAKEELGHLTGKPETHVAIIKALNGIKDEAIRTEAFSVVKSHNETLNSAFTTKGSSVISKGDNGDAGAELDSLAKTYQKKETVDYFTAYEAVSKANPELYAKAVQN